MKDTEQVREKLLESIGKERLNHSLRVMEEAGKLAKCYGEDVSKAMIAGLLHDCGRFNDKAYLLKKVEEFGIILDKIYKKNTNLLHAYVGSEVAREEYGITDSEILKAIKYHTTGRANMSMLEKIVYMADYIEPFRNFEGIDEIRTLCYKEKNIDEALLKAIDKTIVFVLKRRQIIHQDTIAARNYLLFVEWFD